MISKNQFGFRTNRSCENALLEFTNYIVTSIDKHSKVQAIFLDPAKAFDTVSVPILINKLER